MPAQWETANKDYPQRPAKTGTLIVATGAVNYYVSPPGLNDWRLMDNRSAPTAEPVHCAGFDIRFEVVGATEYYFNWV